MAGVQVGWRSGGPSRFDERAKARKNCQCVTILTGGIWMQGRRTCRNIRVGTGRVLVVHCSNCTWIASQLCECV